MRKMMEDLMALQQLEFGAPARVPALMEKENLRKKIPAAILGHFDRLVARGKKAVAAVRNGVCGGCHMRLTAGKLIALAAANDICICDNCGRYLHLADGETISLGEPKLKVAKPGQRRSRKAMAEAV